MKNNRSVCLFGAALDTGNMGVSALAASLIKVIMEMWPDAHISLLVGNRCPGEHQLEVGGRTVRVKVVNYRLSPASGPGKHLFWIFLLACIRRILPPAMLRKRITESNEWLKTLARADLVGDIRGGDGFSDIYGTWRMIIGSMPSLIAILLGNPPALLPQTYGPFESRFSRSLARWILNRSTLILSRDRKGLGTVEALCGDGISRKLKYCPDVAFLLDSKQPDRLDAVPPMPENLETRWIGLNINGLMYHGGYSRDNMFGLKIDYKELAMVLVERLLAETAAHILLVPHSFGRPEHVDSDVGACMDVLRAKGQSSEGRLHVVAGEYDQHEIKGIIGQCEFFIGSRMHSCIAALSQGIPTVGVAYSGKFEGVFASVHAKAMVVDLRFVDMKTAVDAIMREYRKRAETRPALERCMGVVKELIRDTFQNLSAVNRHRAGNLLENRSPEPVGHKARDKGVTFVSAVNDEAVFRSNVLASPVLAEGHGHEILVRRGYPSAGLAYNDALDAAKNDIVVFLHQDVYLPGRWDERLIREIERLEGAGCNWGVLGCFGMSVEGRPAGHVYSNGLGTELGENCGPVSAQSLDEMVLVLRKSKGMRFDPGLPHFHLYGTDICLDAAQSGLENFVICNFCVHNSLPVRRLPSEFWQCARYLVGKWKRRLPVRTCCITLLPSSLRMWLLRLRLELWFTFKGASGSAAARLPRPSEAIVRSVAGRKAIQSAGREYAQ